MDFAKENMEITEHDKETPSLRIPFDNKHLEGLTLEDEVVVTLRGSVTSLTGKGKWDPGLCLRLKSGSVETVEKDSGKKDADKETLDDFIEGDL